jgi:hypothetical protein
MLEPLPGPETSCSWLAYRSYRDGCFGSYEYAMAELGMGRSSLRPQHRMGHRNTEDLKRCPALTRNLPATAWRSTLLSAQY